MRQILKRTAFGDNMKLIHKFTVSTKKEEAKKRNGCSYSFLILSVKPQGLTPLRTFQKLVIICTPSNGDVQYTQYCGEVF